MVAITEVPIDLTMLLTVMAQLSVVTLRGGSTGPWPYTVLCTEYCMLPSQDRAAPAAEALHRKRSNAYLIKYCWKMLSLTHLCDL